MHRESRTMLLLILFVGIVDSKHQHALTKARAQRKKNNRKLIEMTQDIIAITKILVHHKFGFYFAKPVFNTFCRMIH